MSRNPFLNKIQNALRSSLLTRFTAVFVATILIPSLAVLTYSIWDAGRSTRENVMVTSRSVSRDVFDSVSEVFGAASDLADQLVFDTTLRDYLEDDFPENGEAVVHFLRRIRPILDYAVRFKGSGIDGARIVMSNPTQPESWPYFVSERRMLDLAWYREFRESDENTIWIYPHTSGVYSRFDTDQTTRRPAYTVAKKIFDFQGAYLGAVIVDVLQESVHGDMRDLALETMEFAIFTEDGRFWHDATASGAPVDEKVRADWISSVSAAAHRQEVTIGTGITYLAWPIVETGLIVSARVNLRSLVLESALSRIVVGLVIVLGVVGMEFATYLILNQIFRRLRKMTSTMNRVADGEFDHRIPVETNDEIGQIAEDFNLLIGRIDELVTDSVRRETLQKDTELKALQFQINPHFIYNTIDTLRMRLILAHEDEIADSMADFGKLIRYNVSGDPLFATLGDELEHLEKYVRLQRLRYDGRLRVDTTRAAKHAEARVLKFLLQPLVENSIRHGMPEDEDSTLVIEIVAESMDGSLYLVVRDNGEGITPQRLAELREFLRSDDSRLDVDGENGIGLANIVGRLHRFYGTRASLSIDSIPDECTEIELSLPAEPGTHDPADR